MQELVSPRERTLGTATLVLGLALWAALIAGTFGAALVALAAGFVLYLFVQSALIAHIQGNGVELSPAQFPDLHEQFVACCHRLQMRNTPAAYVLHGGGHLNAFATKFLGRDYVVLYSEVLSAMKDHPDGVRFYIGHELGHVRMKHLRGQMLRWPALWLPLLGAAYSRARETTCDLHGAACCASPETAARALVALAAGAERWKDADLAAFRAQVAHASGFWMSFHELTSGYPWLTKRALRVGMPGQPMPRRHALAWVLAAVVPYAGRLGGGFGLLILIYVIGVLAAVALPAYHDYTARAKFTEAMDLSQPARDGLARYYQTVGEVPDTLDKAGVAAQPSPTVTLSLDAGSMTLTVATPQGDLVFTPSLDAQNRVTWSCSAGEGVKPGQVPASCR